MTTAEDDFLKTKREVIGQITVCSGCCCGAVGWGLSRKLEGKVALITGGSSGIGLATAMRLVAEGAYVFITGRRKAELDDAVKQIGSAETGIQSDVAKSTDLDKVYEAVKQQKGHVDILFANAGIGEFAPLGQITE